MDSFADTFSRKFPKDTTPAFILDLGVNFKDFIPLLDSSTDKDIKTLETLPWQVKLLQNLPTEDAAGAQELFKEGWAALSYAWGEYLPDPTRRDIYDGDRKVDRWPLAVGDSYDDSKRSNRTSKPPNDFDWYIPKAGKPGAPKFSVIDMKRVCLRRGKRYVWWDWACIPQQDFSKGYTNSPPELPGVLKSMKNQEIAKQKYVYQRATIGGVWLHTLDWNDAPEDSPVKKLLSMTPPTMNSITIDQLLQTQVVTPTQPDSRTSIDEIVFAGTKSKEGIKKVLDNIRTVLQTIRPPLPQQMTKDDPTLPGDGWFRSLWSFQEGRLMTDPLLLDKNGKSFTLASISDRKDATYTHLCSVPTFLASQISLTISILDAGSSQRVTAQKDKVHAGFLDFAAEQRAYLLDYLRYLTASGLVIESNESPLQLLAAARRTRFPSLSWQDNYYAMIGVLDLFGDVKMAGADSGDAYYFPKEVIQKNFFEALVARFQWKMLLFAKFTQDPVNSWTAISMGHFEPVEPYFQSFIGTLIDFKLDQSKPLPYLTYLRDPDEIVIKPASGSSKLTVWRFGKMVTPPPGPDGRPSWPKPEFATSGLSFYESTPNNIYEIRRGEQGDDEKYVKEGWVDIDVDPKKVPIRPILSKPVNHSSLLKILPAEKYILIPFQDPGFNLGRWGSGDPTGPSSRCLMLGDATNKEDVWKGTFKYIIDIANAPVVEVNASEVHVKWQ